MRDLEDDFTTTPTPAPSSTTDYGKEEILQREFVDYRIEITTSSSREGME